MIPENHSPGDTALFHLLYQTFPGFFRLIFCDLISGENDQIGFFCPDGFLYQLIAHFGLSRPQTDVHVCHLNNFELPVRFEFQFILSLYRYRHKQTGQYQSRQGECFIYHIRFFSELQAYGLP